MNDIIVQNVCKRFDSHIILHQASFTIPCGSISAICGASGTGKTTLFRLIAGLERPDSGHILGMDTHRLAYVFQEPRLLPSATAQSNITCVLPRHRQKEAKQIAAQWLNAVGLSEYASAFPHELSGGMKSRLSLARALASEPTLLLLDEPFNGLDAQTKEKMISCILEYAKGMTVLLITHAQEEIEAMGAQVIYRFPGTNEKVV